MSFLDRALPSAGTLRRTTAVAAIAATTLLAACTTAQQSTEFSGAAADVSAAVKSFADAAGSDSSDRICDNLLTADLAKALGATAGGNCTEAVQRAIDNSDYTSLRVVGVKVTPEQNPQSAVATIDTIEEDGTREISLELVGKQWRVAALDPKPAPAATTPDADGDEPAGTTRAN